MADRNVMLAFPHPGIVRAEFMLSVLDSCRGDHTPVGAIADMSSGPFMAHARNELARLFLASEAEWLFTVDADMVFTRQTIPALLSWAHRETRPVVAALCYTLTPDGRRTAVAYRADKDDQGLIFASLSADDLPADDLVKVDGTGPACMLIHRDVFERLDAAAEAPGLWYAEQVIDGRCFGEDLSFCLRLRAAGIPVHICTAVQVGHIKAGQIGQVCP